MISDRKKDVSEGNLTERRRYQTDRRSFLGQKPDTKKGRGFLTERRSFLERNLTERRRFLT